MLICKTEAQFTEEKQNTVGHTSVQHLVSANKIFDACMPLQKQEKTCREMRHVYIVLPQNHFLRLIDQQNRIFLRAVFFSSPGCVRN